MKADIEQLEPLLKDATLKYDDLMLKVPSIPRPEVPIGKGEEDNVEIRKVGTKRTFSFKARDHVELMTMHGMVNWCTR